MSVPAPADRRRRRARWAAILLPACFAAVALQCKTSSHRTDVRDLIRADQEFFEQSLGKMVESGAVDDEVRVMYADYMEGERAYFDRWETHVRSMWALNASPDATREDFDRLLGTIRADRAAFGDETVRFLSQLHDALEPDQWAAVQEHLARAEGQWRELAR